MTSHCSIPGCRREAIDAWGIIGSKGLSNKAKKAGIKHGDNKALCETHRRVVTCLASGLDNYDFRPYVLVFFNPNLKVKGHKCAVPKCTEGGKYPLPRGETQVVWVCIPDRALLQQLLPFLSITAAVKQVGKWRGDPKCSCGQKRCPICLRCSACLPRCKHTCKNGHNQRESCKPCKKCKKLLCIYCSGSFCSSCGLCKRCDNTCEECGRCSKACSCYGEADVALGTWNLPASLNLRAAAARFYTLIEKADVNSLYRPDLEEYARELASVFSNYLDMAIGGEIRYGSESNDGVQALLPRITTRYLENDAHSSRGKAWYEWKGLRDDYGTSILKEAETALFEGEWEGNLGGPMWGECAKTLRLHEEGEYSDIVFVDQAFSLEHNNGCVFNKLWNTSKLKDVLSAVFEGHIDRIVKYLPSKEQSKYQAWKEYGDHTFR